jgi:hypothetical protein
VAAPVYSARLLAGGATDSLDATVPGGVLWVVRDAVIFFDGADSNDGYSLSGYLVDGAAIVIQTGQSTAGQILLEHWTGRQVLNPGDRLSFGASTMNWYVTVSGYVLTLP